MTLKHIKYHIKFTIIRFPVQIMGHIDIINKTSIEGLQHCILGQAYTYIAKYDFYVPCL